MIDRLTQMRGEDGAVPRPAKPPVYDDLERLLLQDWAAKGRRGVTQAVARLRHLHRAFTGWDAKAMTSDRIMAYALHRREEGAAVATINLSLAILHRSFVLAKRAGLLRDVPIMDRLRGAVQRTGTIERGDLEAVLAILPPRYVPLVRFLHLTGWRESEGLTLQWSAVDDRELCLAPEHSKTGQGRRLPYRASTELAALIDTQRQNRTFSPYVFPGRAARPLDRTTLQKAWRRSCVHVGIPKAILHDLRRTMTRDLRRAGVSPGVAMVQLGHKDVRTHQGYSVVLPEDQAAALRRLEELRASEPLRRSVAKIG